MAGLACHPHRDIAVEQNIAALGNSFRQVLGRQSRRVRITRKKHDTGFYQKVVDYCLASQGISLDDVDLVVRNCYVSA